MSAQDDRVDDDGESVTVAFGDLPDRVSAGSPSETLVQLTDNDYVPVTLGWEETAFTAEEPTSPGAMTGVDLRAVAVTATDKRPEIGFTLSFTVNTANGTARQPDDYEELSTTATFDRDDFTRRTVDGQSRYVASADFTVNVEHDTVNEPLERFTVRLAFAASSQPHLSLGDWTATVTTTDDVASLADLQTTVTARSSAVEPGGELTYDWSVRNGRPRRGDGHGPHRRPGRGRDLRLGPGDHPRRRSSAGSPAGGSPAPSGRYRSATPPAGRSSSGSRATPRRMWASPPSRQRTNSTAPRRTTTPR